MDLLRLEAPVLGQVGFGHREGSPSGGDRSTWNSGIQSRNDTVRKRWLHSVRFQRWSARRSRRSCARLPAFWQFIGLGRADRGLLRTLDALSDRAVDNGGFFALDDIDQVECATARRVPDRLRAAGILC
ncbi:VWA domain-containing protein [Nocardia sp. R6R-6]|uniref:VWA domain-containing protein n=1 Tax=Nocardia sp. R6R-6 TaxID=3459303 RepID=UPI00403E16D5